MLESQSSPKLRKGRKTSTIACVKCPSISSSGYCRGRPYWTLACSLSTRSGWDGCSSQQQSSTSDSSFALPPAGFLQTNTRVHHKSHTGLPQSGCSHRALTITGSHVQTQATETGVQEPTTEQSRWFTTFDHNQLRLI